jgi:hypothetical protein
MKPQSQGVQSGPISFSQPATNFTVPDENSLPLPPADFSIPKETPPVPDFNSFQQISQEMPLPPPMPPGQGAGFNQDIPLPPLGLTQQTNQTMQQPSDFQQTTKTPVIKIPMPPKKQEQQPIQDIQQSGIQHITEEEAEEFELPDFDDEELKELEEKEDAAAEEEDADSHDWVTEPQSKYALREAVAPPRKPATLMSEPQQVVKPMQIPLDKYLDLSDFFRLKEDLFSAKTTARNMEEQIVSETYKATLEKCNSFSSTLNAIQDRLMLIEGKLFDRPEVNE